LLNKAVARDPNYASAWVTLGINRSLMSGSFVASADEAKPLLAEAERDIRRGLVIAPNLARGYAALGQLAVQRLDYPTALESQRRALALAPNDPSVLVSVLNSLPFYGDLVEAQRAAQTLVSVDPLNPNAYSCAASVFDVTGRADKAFEAAKKAVSLSSANVGALGTLGFTSIELGNFETALKAAAAMPADDFGPPVIRALAAARQGRRSEMEKQIGILRSAYGDYASFQYAEIYAQAGDIDQAFAALDTAVKARDPGLSSTMREPLLKPLRKDPRMLAIVKRLRFPTIDPGIGRA
jgi:tetratricopeptide (TPR) repeat protein